MSSFLIPMSLASVTPTMSASYSASLLVVQNPQWMAYWIKSPLGDVRTRPMLDLFMLLEPSTESVYLDVEHSVRLSSSLLA